jgi:pimeloyl-ACP methyl ester carboxylesterase
LILVPGLNCTDRLFGPQIEALSRSRPLAVADNGSDASIPEMAHRLLTHAPDRFALAGLSMGGYVALEVMRQAPQRVLALALSDTTARPDTDEARESREKLIALAANGRFDEIHDLMWPRLVAERHRVDRSLSEAVLP